MAHPHAPIPLFGGEHADVSFEFLWQRVLPPTREPALLHADIHSIKHLFPLHVEGHHASGPRWALRALQDALAEWWTVRGMTGFVLAGTADPYPAVPYVGRMAEVLSYEGSPWHYRPHEVRGEMRGFRFVAGSPLHARVYIEPFYAPYSSPRLFISLGEEKTTRRIYYQREINNPWPDPELFKTWLQAYAREEMERDATRHRDYCSAMHAALGWQR